MDVPGDAPILVQFDRPVVPDTVRGRFDVSPSIPGCDVHSAFGAPLSAPCRIVWLKDRTGFTLEHPRAVLAANKRYTFTLRGGFADPEGAVNSVDHQWDITTAPAPTIRSFTPSPGAPDVPADVPLVVAFSTPMDATTTARSISLEPAVAGTRVVQNSRDHARFLVVPGQPLQSGVTYRLTVRDGATDEHGEPLAAPAAIAFTAGALSAAPHAVILAGPPKSGATEIVVANLGASAPGDPIPAQVALAAAVCPAPGGCGAASTGAPLYTFSAAVLSPNGSWLAVVENDQTQAGTPPTTVVTHLPTGAAVTAVPDATLPSWSPDSTTLAFSRGGQVQLFHPRTGVTSTLPAGDPVTSPPEWEPRGELLVLDCVSASGMEHLDIGDAVVLARYPVPNLTGSNTSPAVSPDGSQLAVFRLASGGHGAEGTWVVGIGAGAVGPERHLNSNARPLGWSDPGTVLSLTRSPAGKPGLALVSASGGGVVAVNPGPPVASLSSLALSASGRLLAFLAPDASGTVQVEVESALGGRAMAVTSFAPGTLDAEAVVLT